jgi:glycosyltransferase involved in cell wall biosynthesis
LISIVSFSESRGGAAKAAHKLYLVLQKKGIVVQYVVVEKFSTDNLVLAPGRVEFFLHFVKRLFVFFIQKLQLSKNLVKHSINLFSCNTVLKAIQNSELVHLNWINNETISVENLCRIQGKIIITLHDEWFYCGSEHLALESKRFIEGYTASNTNIIGIDWDRITWLRKKKALSTIKDRVIFTAPSAWMLKRAHESALLRNFDIRLIPNCLDTEIFKPMANEFPSRYGVSADDRVILFGAVYGKNMHLKGFHLLQEALLLLATRVTNNHNIVLVTFGGKEGESRTDLGFRHVEVGHIAESSKLAQLYSRADFTVVPSLLESFGQVAAESLSCETPVVAFDCSGLQDIVRHKVNGYLAKPYSIESLCEGMKWLLTSDLSSLRLLGRNGRRHVIDNFSDSVVVEKLLSLYREQRIDV